MRTDLARDDFAAIKTAGRDVIEHHIQNVWTLAEYIAFINMDVRPGEGRLYDDTAMWAEEGIVTASQMADHLDGACARNVEKSELSAYA